MADRPRRYEVELTRAAEKELERLPGKVRNQIGRTIKRLEERYQAGERPQDIRPIEGRPGSFGIDSGEFRILYEPDEAARLLTIWRIANRKDVYRNL